MPKPEKYRSAFGARLYAARRHAGLSQAVLAGKVGMSQSTLAEAETTAQGSAKTAQLAHATGVDSHWLATGQGQMNPESALHQVAEVHASYFANNDAAQAPTPISQPLSSRQIVLQLGDCLAKLDHLARLAVAPLLQRLAEYPEEREQIAIHFERTVSPGNEPTPRSTDSHREKLAAAAVRRTK